jgi:hypothetical protein
MDGEMARFAFSIAKSSYLWQQISPKEALSYHKVQWMSTCDYKASKNNIAMNYLKFRLDNPHESQLKGN